MSVQASDAPVLWSRNLRKTFRRKTGEIVTALDGVSFDIASGTLTALVGPDGAGKTSFIRLACGLLTPDAGELKILGIEIARDPQQVQDRIAYMPQRFGLYEDLTVQENLDLYADLHGLTGGERRIQYPRLMEMTALGPFVKRLAGQLSGGMKQKLGLACALVRSPELLLLDEPTAGVDPLSRHELWEIILRLIKEQQTTVLISTSYLDEAERCEQAVVLHQGKILAQGRPHDVSKLADGRVVLVSPLQGQPARRLQARLLDASEVVDAVPEAGRVRIIQGNAEAGREQAPRSDLLAGLAVSQTPARFEDGFMILLRQAEGARPSAATTLDQPIERHGGETVIEVRGLVRMFGNFTAVDHVSFEVKRGELFGLLGPNGAGKTTTFRMLCGLLPVTSGTLRVAGADLRTARASAREHIGYVAQKFSLYRQLSVIENLEFFASAYGLRGARKRRRVDWALSQFELQDLKALPSGQLPGGFKQRLAMAAALLHEPEILFLDEPTSGADPLARREFWRRITALAEQGVTVIVTTHFMEEAEYCDRIAILDEGRVLAQGTTAELRSRAPAREGGEPSMEDAFIAIVEDARHRQMSERARTGTA
jgi:ABC-2 type transport system ATP-binding protein